MRGSYVYFDVTLEFSKNTKSVAVLPAFFKGSIVQSLHQVFGEIGGLGVQVDVLRFEEEEPVRAILRVPAAHYFKLRTALNVINEFQGHPCRFNINCASPVLLSLVRQEF